MESLFIVIMILIAVTVISGNYLRTRSSVTIITVAKSSATFACTYINTGVVSNDTEYSSLNRVIDLLNYTTPHLTLNDFKYASNSTVFLLNLTVVSGIPLAPAVRSSIEGSLSEFIKNELVSRSLVSLKNGSVYYDGKKVTVEVRVK